MNCLLWREGQPGVGLTATGVGGLTLRQSLWEVGKVGEGWWLWMPLPTTVTVTMETEKTPTGERGQDLSKSSTAREAK